MEEIALKTEILNHCKEVVDEKHRNLLALDKAAQTSANNETKSSTGDKYETGRAMMHLEKERLASQINEVLKLKKPLDQINPMKISDVVELGSVVITERRNFFVSASLGEIHLNNEVFFCISPVAPIGKLLIGKQPGDVVEFARQKILIQMVF